MSRPITLHFYEDPGHGWLKAPIKLLEELQIVAEGIFLRRHSYSRQLMEQRPRPSWEREEGGRR